MLMHLPLSSLPCLTVLFIFAVNAQASTSTSTSPEGIAFFEQKIRPLLADKCYSCHSAGAKKLKGGLHLDTESGGHRGGDSGQAAIVPGDVEASLLINSVRYDDEQLQMPPKEKLTDAEIADLTAWVKMGAPDPRTGVTAEVKRADKTWWSLQKLSKATPPQVEGIPQEWTKSAIDQFIYARMAAEGLTPNPPASAKELIKRLSYDLTGLPPTIEEVTAFEANTAKEGEAAVEKLVDRLLASPRYGEQWGRHWLDVIRFGESTGFERNVIINNAWPFRDYVISSLNEDKPFNQFITEHLAGDVINYDDPKVSIGSAFLVTGPYDNVANGDLVAQAQIRADTLDDMITATGTAFLGVTLNCARCHNHKFDPITQEDYFRVRAALEGVNHGERMLGTREERQALAAEFKAIEDRLKTLEEEKNALVKMISSRLPSPAEVAKLDPAPASDLTEEKFDAVEASMIKLRIISTTQNVKSGFGARMDELEVWTDEATPRNVALAKNGSVASGASAKQGEAFGDTYDVSRVIDGEYGMRWFAGNPSELTITLKNPERINRITFSNIRNVPGATATSSLGPTATEYEIFTSTDGKQWTKVADSMHRKAHSESLAIERQWRLASDEERAKQDLVLKNIYLAEQEKIAIKARQQVWAGIFTEPKSNTFIHIGGDPQKKGPEVLPSSLALLDKVTRPYSLAVNAEEGERRLALAKWISSDDNPLTARVLVNRLWHYHFGTGIVDTPSDLGYLGGKPTHPELLDWLANRLHAHGWKLKALHREIVLSQTYRQAGTFREEASRKDKDARLLWRFPPRRLTGEEIRDTLLQASGQLDLKMGGPGFRLYKYLEDNVATYVPLDQHGPETWRRAVYHQYARASLVDLLNDFDAPDVASATPRRASTTTPMQALTMLNHSFTVDMSEALTSKVKKEAGEDLHAQIRRMFELVLLREPEGAEMSAASQLAETEGLSTLARALLNANELIYLN